MTSLMAAIVQAGVRRAAPAGEVLLREGEHAERVVLVEQGRVKVTVRASGTVPAVLAIRGPGEVLGELGALTGAAHGATVTTLEPCRFVAADAARFRRRVLGDAGLSAAALLVAAGRLGGADARLTEHLVSDTRTRVARRLLELLDDAGDAASLPLTQAELAGLVGASLEATGKALRALRRDGLIGGGRGRIVVGDRAALAAVAEAGAPPLS